MSFAVRSQPIVAYLRKSTTDADRQVQSLDRQREAVLAYVERLNYGPVDRWFTDEQSGKSFSRPGYEALLTFCRAYPQPKLEPGRIICLDFDRFSRPVDEQYRADPIEYQRQVILLKDLGWEIEYVLTPTSGNRMLDSITATLKSSMAGEYLEKLSLSARSGKYKTGTSGYWNGGRAPFPAQRYNDDDLTRPLTNGMRSKNRASVLGPGRPEDVELWTTAAKRLISGSGTREISRWLNEQRAGGLKWTHQGVMKCFTNTALIGRVSYHFNTPEGRVTKEVDARWAPIVDTDLFLAVRDELLQRRAKDRRRPSASDFYCLDLYCYDCGMRYRAATRGPFKRNYAHPSPNPGTLCRTWQVDAECAERALRDLVLHQRANPAFLEQLQRRLSDHESIQSGLDQDLLRNQIQIDSFRRQEERLMMAIRFCDDESEMAEIMATRRQLKQDLVQAAEARKELERRRSDVRLWNQRVIAAAEQAAHLAAAWDEEPEIRRSILALWLTKAWVQVLPHSGGPRSAPRLLHASLRMSPTEIIPVELNNHPTDISRQRSSHKVVIPVQYVGSLPARSTPKTPVRWTPAEIALSGVPDEGGVAGGAGQSVGLR